MLINVIFNRKIDENRKLNCIFISDDKSNEINAKVTYYNQIKNVGTEVYIWNSLVQKKTYIQLSISF